MRVAIVIGTVRLSLSRLGGGTKQVVSMRVCIRCRPLSEQETETSIIVAAEKGNGDKPGHIFLTNPSPREGEPPQFVFTYDFVWGPGNNVVEVFNNVVEPLLMGAFDGVNGTILAHGQSGSGKTRTMMGAPDDPGLVHSVVTGLFDKVRSWGEGCTTRVFLSFMQLRGGCTDGFAGRGRQSGQERLPHRTQQCPHADGAGRFAAPRADEACNRHGR